MSNTAKIYACGFPNEEPYSSIIKEQKIIVLTEQELLQETNINENDVLLLFCQEFETHIIDYLGILTKKLEKNPLVIIGKNYSQSYLENLFEQHPFTYIKLPATKEQIIEELIKAKENKCFYIPKPNPKDWLDKAKANLVAFHEVATALTAEKNIEKLLDLILTKTRHLAKADAGSLYLKEGDNHLRFVLTQNISSDWNGKKDVLLEIKENSISGYTAKTSKPFNLLDVYSIPESISVSYNKNFDMSSGYRTKSMITMAMYNNSGEVLGVIQLINKRKDYDQRIPADTGYPEELAGFH